MVKVKEKQLHDSLVELGPEKLASLLLEIASKNPEAKEAIDRTLSSPEDNLKRFRKRLSALTRRTDFISWRESSSYANNLTSILDDIGEDNPDHKSCLEGLGLFYSFDDVIFEQCDDSSGTIGDVFRVDAAELFRHHASECEDKEWVCDWIIEINSTDGYGVRDCLFESLKKFLSKKEIRAFADKVRKRAQKEKGEWEKKSYFRNLATIAIQLKDADLYKDAQIECFGELHPRCNLEIAKIHYSNKEYEKALGQLDSIKDRLHISSECKELRLKIYEKLGNNKEAEKIVLENFRDSRSKDSLEEVLHYLKEDQKQNFIEGEVKSILDSSRFSTIDLKFLIELKRFDEAEKYVLNFKNQVDGDLYYALVPISKSLESSECLVAASVCYRALIDSVLKRAKAKNYHHAVSYLKRLDRLSPKITAWKGLESHSEYKERLNEAHKLKTSFWKKYSG